MNQSYDNGHVYSVGAGDLSRKSPREELPHVSQPSLFTILRVRFGKY